MAVSRVQKFKEYRNSLIKEETPVLETPKSIEQPHGDSRNKETTSTLPMDEVIKTLHEEDKEAVFLKETRKRNIILISILIGAAVLLIAGIVIFGIIVWR